MDGENEIPDELELTNLVEGDDTQEGEGQTSETPQPAEDDESQGGEEEFSVEIEGEDDGEEETHALREVRRELRETQRKLAEMQKVSAPKVELGPKPTLESSEWDEDKFAADLEAWYDAKRRQDDEAVNEQRQREKANEQFTKAVTNYRAAAAQKGIRDIEEAETTVASVLGAETAGLIVQYSKNPELVIAALHKHPAKLNAIAAEQDPLRRVRLIWELEGKVKTTVKRAAPPPAERSSIQSGSAPASASVDKEEERLLAAAMKSGDMTEYAKYRRQKRQRSE